jgi:signal transduction histidine kinase
MLQHPERLLKKEKIPNEVVQRYKLQEESVRKETYQTASSLALIFMLAGVALDWVVVPHQAANFFFIRCTCASLLGVVLYFLKDYDLSGTRLRVLGHLVAFLPTVSILLMIFLLGKDNSTYYAGLNLVLIGASMLLRWPTRDSIISATLCVLCYMLVSWYARGEQNGGFKIWFNNFFFLFVTAFFSCIGTKMYNKLRFGEFLLIDQLERSSREISIAHEKLRALDAAKTRFFANVSHELRTPLTLILGPLEHLKSTAAVVRDRQTRDLVEMLEENGLRLLRLIDNLLDLVRLDSAAIPMRVSRIPIRNFLEGMVGALAATANLKGIQLDYEAELYPDVEECLLDPDRLEKILLNLGMNALKFTPRGGRILLKVESNKEYVKFSVSDTGAGISENDKLFIFERFWQADMSAKRKHGGVGIGLALTKQLTDSMNGVITVESAEGKGTTFHVKLPLYVKSDLDYLVPYAQQQDPDLVEKLHQKAQLAGLNEDNNFQVQDSSLINTLPTDGVSRARILIADDEPGLRRYLHTALYTHEIIEARDGIEAWELARQQLPDLIVLDLMMPGLDGLEVTKRLRKHLPTSRIPIILITATAEETPRLEALRAGVSEFITKPFSTAELNARLNNLLQQKRYEKDLSTSKQELEIAHEELKDNETRLVHAESLSALGRMSAGIIHEINNPLNYATTALHTLKTFTKILPTDEQNEFKEILSDLGEGISRVVNIVTDLRSFTKGGMSPFHEVDLGKVLEASRRLVSSAIGDIKVDWYVEQNLNVWGSENQLVQVFVNLINNAASFVTNAKARGEEPLLTIHAKRSDTGLVYAFVRDNGSGIRAEDLGKVFEPFFTRRDVGSGMGLGLSICHQICQSHDADLSVRSEYGAWTEFSVLFPAPSSKRRSGLTDVIPLPRANSTLISRS